MAKYEYQCEHCSYINQKGGERQKFTCSSCNQKTKAIRVNNIEDTQIINTEDTPINLDFSVDTTKTEFTQIDANSTPEQVIKSPQKNIKVPVQGQPIRRPFAVDTIQQFPEQLDALMRKKSNNEIWDVSKEEEKKLAEAYTEVLNEYFPQIDSKAGKLGIAVGLTIITYAPRIIKFAEEYSKRKGGKKNEPRNDNTDNSNAGTNTDNTNGNTSNQ
jgi:hypothetical protein